MPLPSYLVEGASLRYTSAPGRASVTPRSAVLTSLTVLTVVTRQPQGRGVQLCAGLCSDPAASGQGGSSSPGDCLVPRPSRTNPSHLSLQGFICAAPAPLIAHCQRRQFLLGEQVSGIPQKSALQGRATPEQDGKAAASLLRLALYPESSSSRCRDSDTSCSTEILPGIIGVRQAAGCCPASPERWDQRSYRRVAIPSC